MLFVFLRYACVIITVIHLIYCIIIFYCVVSTPDSLGGPRGMHVLLLCLICCIMLIVYCIVLRSVITTTGHGVRKEIRHRGIYIAMHHVLLCMHSSKRWCNTQESILAAHALTTCTLMFAISSLDLE